MRTLRAIPVVAALALALCAGAHAEDADTDVGSDGWTGLWPVQDSQLVHVSSSEGDDANTGLSADAPVKTLAHAMVLLRDGQPDHLLLKRGDAWKEALGPWALSGKSATEPIVIGAYGEEGPRPVLKTGGLEVAFRSDPEANAGNLAIVGIHFYAHSRDPNSPDFKFTPDESVGIRWSGGRLLFEDCVVQSYRLGVSVRGRVEGGNPTGSLTMRRCQVLDCYPAGDQPSYGIRVDDMNGVAIEQCVVDFNGWNGYLARVSDGRSGARSPRCHNIVVASSCRNVVLRGNIIARGSSHGAMIHAGGVIEGNLFVRNSAALLVGGGQEPAVGGVSARVVGNVILEAEDIGDSEHGYGIELTNIKAAEVYNNIIAGDRRSAPGGPAVQVTGRDGGGVGAHNVVVRNNTVYDWQGGLWLRPIRSLAWEITRTVVTENLFQALGGKGYVVRLELGRNPRQYVFRRNVYNSKAQPNAAFRIHKTDIGFALWARAVGETSSTASQAEFADPKRGVASYYASIGGAASVAAFLAEARKQSRENWRTEYTAAPVIKYVREGFRLKAEAIMKRVGAVPGFQPM